MKKTSLWEYELRQGSEGRQQMVLYQTIKPLSNWGPRRVLGNRESGSHVSQTRVGISGVTICQLLSLVEDHSLDSVNFPNNLFAASAWDSQGFDGQRKPLGKERQRWAISWTVEWGGASKVACVGTAASATQRMHVLTLITILKAILIEVSETMEKPAPEYHPWSCRLMLQYWE